uniref:Profilin n=1 Tax=Peronospora matthiolae TaxID=2874970 RepID=A0AAV1V335_9STRA
MRKSVEIQKKCTIWNESKAIASGMKMGKAYVLDCEKDVTQYIEYAGTQRATTGMPMMDHKSMTLCGGCMKVKQTGAHFPSHYQSKATKVLQLVHTDSTGPMKTKSKSGARYVLTFVADYHKYVVAYFITKKSDVPGKFKTLMNLYENQ